MAKWIQHGISHPGRMKEGAARAGMSTHEYMEKESHSSNPSLRSAANLGLRFEKGGDLHHGKKHVGVRRRK